MATILPGAAQESRLAAKCSARPITEREFAAYPLLARCFLTVELYHSKGRVSESNKSDLFRAHMTRHFSKENHQGYPWVRDEMKAKVHVSPSTLVIETHVAERA
jgi:hypothetical protein